MLRIIRKAVDLAKSLTGAKESSDKKSGRPVKKPKEPCPLQQDPPKIVKVEYLDGTDDAELGGTGTHFSNMPRDAKWVDGTWVKNIDRLTRMPRVKVRFDRPGSHSFKLRFVPPPGTNAAYTATEKARNANFKYQNQDQSLSTGADGTAIVPASLFVTAAGKDTYQVEAEDAQQVKVRSGGTIETWRLIYYVEIKMAGIPAAPSLSSMEGEFAKHGIRLVSLGSVNMTTMENISTGDSDTFKNHARTAYLTTTAPTKEPYVIAAGYTGHLAVKNPNRVLTKSGVNVGPGKPAVVVPVAGPGLTNPAIAPRYLWKGLVTGEKWFVSARFIPDDGSAAVTIPEAKCTAVAASAGTPDRCRSVSVDVTGLAEAAGSIEMTVHWVDRMRGGLSFPGTNLICACTRAWWQDKDAAAQVQVMTHELGHQVKMVADGGGTGPDKVSTHYDSSKGHVGDHCHSGIAAGQARYDSSADSAASICVMYGATNGKDAFCGECSPAVRKQDLSRGWTRL